MTGEEKVIICNYRLRLGFGCNIRNFDKILIVCFADNIHRKFLPFVRNLPPVEQLPE